jgi:formylmethanofuran dehydrogenase subunit A
VDQLVEGLSTQRSMTADLGLVAFGPAFTATADLPLEYELWGRLGGPSRPCVMLDPGNEDALGVMPYRHDPGQAMSALQWATGLELALKWPDLERLSLTVDHPNGGSFLNYPQLIALLMSKPRRDEALAGCHGWARERTGLASISRELTLTEVAAITRLAPARALGLAMKGRLTVGVDADVVVYEDRASDPRAMFSEPRHVVKAGVRVAGRLASPTAGPTAGVASIAARGRRFAASL